jgi:hypothetical protein
MPGPRLHLMLENFLGGGGAGERDFIRKSWASAVYHPMRACIGKKIKFISCMKPDSWASSVKREQRERESRRKAVMGRVEACFTTEEEEESSFSFAR